MTDETVSYWLTGDTSTDDEGCLWRQTDRLCGACDEPLWIMDGYALSGWCSNGHRCYLLDSWTAT